MTSERASCVVVGGGPAGMVLGLLLARARVGVTVLEKHGDFLRDFRGDTVHPSTLQLLDELGLGERFARLPQSRLHQVAFPVDARRTVVLADFNGLKVPHPYVAMVPQWDLLNLLADAARDEPTFTLRMRTEVTELLHGSGRVLGCATARRRGRRGDPRRPRRRLRRPWFGRPPAGPPSAPRVPRSDRRLVVPASPDTAGQSLGVDATRGQRTVRAGDPAKGLPPARLHRQKGSDPELRARGVESFRRDIAELMPDLADRVDSLSSMDDVKHLDVRLNRLHRWHADGLLCIGDAAHAMSPVGGVGINLAVQDAVAAAARLAGPLRRGTVAPADLAAVRTRRLPPTILLQSMQRLMHRALVRPILEGRRSGPPRPVVAVLRHAPRVSHWTAYLIGVGPRPEHAPAFARRPRRDSGITEGPATGGHRAAADDHPPG